MRAAIDEGPDRTAIPPSRRGDNPTLAVDVFVGGYVGTGTVPEIDSLLEVAEEIDAELRARSNGAIALSAGQAQFVSSEILPMSDPDAAETDGYATFRVLAMYTYQNVRRP